MLCPNCHTLSCYICRQVIWGYDHFSNICCCPCNISYLWWILHQEQPLPYTGANDPNKCLLWDPVEQRHTDEVTHTSTNYITHKMADCHMMHFFRSGKLPSRLSKNTRRGIWTWQQKNSKPLRLTLGLAMNFERSNLSIWLMLTLVHAEFMWSLLAHELL